MAKAIKATYVGKIADLKGKTALIQIDGKVAYAQFDQVDLTHRRKNLAHGWHPFALSDFRVEHDLYEDGDVGIPEQIKDRNGQVVLGLCKRCGRAEVELDEPCLLPKGGE